ncbi:protein translocase subunit SecD [Patescibacteria group bacterium]|nr:protein translocase subunit SecD [Patescibacteria group bacterium]MBU1922213.1 protein translocase subunit SecD [Patescibacteria group bacterium]
MPRPIQGSKRNYIRITVAILVVLFLAAGFLDYPAVWDKTAQKINSIIPISIPNFFNIPFRLGLDLQGGTHLVYLANMAQIPEDDREDALQGVRDVIERRVNAFGVAEPVVQTSRVGDSYRLIVELAGVSDVNEAINMIGQTPILEFKEENDEPARELTPEEQQEMTQYNETAMSRAAEALRKALENPDSFIDLVREYSEHELSKARDGDLGWIGPGTEFSDLHSLLDGKEAGALVDTVLETPSYYFIAKINDQREGETEVWASHLLICYDGAASCESALSKEEARAKIEELKSQAAPENFEDSVKENSTEPGAAERGGDLGWFGRGQMIEAFENAVFSQQTGTISDIVETEFGFHLIYKKDEKKIIELNPCVIAIRKKAETDYVPPADEWKNTGLSGKELAKAQLQFDPNTNEPMVGLEFNDQGKDLFAQITEKNVGKPVAIFLDGQAISVPVVNEAIKEGKAVITGQFSIAEAKLLAQRLNAGALPVPIDIISEQTVGPALGSVSLQKSLIAGLIGFALVAIFMIFYYRLPGLLAVLALCFYVVFILALFKLIPVTLTLAGLAGLILSIGMAVDANILIFERLKEEIRSGRPLMSAIDEGFSRAWNSIRDANVTTLIACLILFWFSSSVIKGFALTLGIGVLMSMLSAITVTRVFLKLIAAWRVKEAIWLFGAKPEEEA